MTFEWALGTYEVRSLVRGVLSDENGELWRWRWDLQELLNSDNGKRKLFRSLVVERVKIWNEGLRAFKTSKGRGDVCETSPQTLFGPYREREMECAFNAGKIVIGAEVGDGTWGVIQKKNKEHHAEYHEHCRHMASNSKLYTIIAEQ